MARPKKKEIYLKKNKKYIDLDPLIKMEGKYDIAFIPTIKGTGKTFGAIREGLIRFQQTGKPFVYARATFEQLKEFAALDKYPALLETLGYYLPKNEKISSRGHFKLKNRTKTNPTRALTPITYFASVNQAMNIQSSKFIPPSLVIFDEVLHHFNKNPQAIVDKTINLTGSILRDHNAPIWFISNLIDQNDILIRTFGLERIIDKVPAGKIKKVIRYKNTGKMIEKKILLNHGKKIDFGNGKENIKMQEYKTIKVPEQIRLRILIYKPDTSKEFKKSTSQSIGYKLATFSDYGKVITTDEFVHKLKDLKYIKRLGNFKFKININGQEWGLWTYTIKGKEIYQFSKKFNKNGRTYYFSYMDWESGSIIGNFDFIKRLKNKLIRKEIEFSDLTAFEAIVGLIRQKK